MHGEERKKKRGGLTAGLAGMGDAQDIIHCFIFHRWANAASNPGGLERWPAKEGAKIEIVKKIISRPRPSLAAKTSSE